MYILHNYTKQQINNNISKTNFFNTPLNEKSLDFIIKPTLLFINSNGLIDLQSSCGNTWALTIFILIMVIN